MKLFVLGIFAPLLAFASMETTCKSGSAERKVTVEYENEETKVPCSVKYFKPSEGDTEPKELWNAQNDATYCQEKASGLVETLSGAGWQCDTAGGAMGGEAKEEAKEETKEETAEEESDG